MKPVVVVTPGYKRFHFRFWQVGSSSTALKLFCQAFAEVMMRLRPKKKSALLVDKFAGQKN
jgi:hypothetical protein